ncbi:PTS transporter subunit EIIC [Paenibacillus terrae]|uniref:PTS transporter subunit EIIC n=1 Tax=Paenibacillus terrae TaxID=159743 RepID=UPI0011EAFB6E|nr:PTS transporter subunit EIIC [Paenibacillus terrae]
MNQDLLSKEMSSQTGGEDKQEPTSGSDKTVTKGNPISRLFDFISGVFTSILPALIGAGIIQVIASVLLYLDIDSNFKIFTIIVYISGIVFYLLPFMVAVSAAKKLGSNIFIAAVIGGCSFFPSLTEVLKSAKEISSTSLPVAEPQYISSFILILIAVWLAAKIEQGLGKLNRYSIQLLVAPTLTLIIIMPLLLFVFGPLWTALAHTLSEEFSSLFFFNSEVLAGLLYGGTIPLLHFSGMQYMLVNDMLESVAATGYDYIAPVMVSAVMAQAGAAFGVCIKSKNSKVKALAATTGLLAMLGIIEPAMYGVNVRFKKPFLAALIGGAIGGAFVCLFETAITSLVSLFGLMTLPLFSDSTLVYAVFGMVISFVTAGVITYFMGFADEQEEHSKGATASGISTASDLVVEKSANS